MQQVESSSHFVTTGFPTSDERTTSLDLRRRSSERPLFFAVLAVSLLIWLAAVVSVVLAAYAVILGLFMYFSHVMFVAYIRGSAVRVSDQQFPELHARLLILSKRIGLKNPPEFYLTQANGSLNALATRFHRSEMIVVFAELLEACEGNDEARDFVISHELAHLKARHLRWWLLTVPGRMIPFLGHAYSRACEYTADSWGHAVSGRSPRNAQGLVVLSVGGKLAKKVNIPMFLEQRRELTGGLMTLGRWLSGYPSLSERLAAITPGSPVAYTSWKSTVKALAIIFLLFAVPIVGGTIAIAKISSAAKTVATSESTSDEELYYGSDYYDEESSSVETD